MFGNAVLGFLGAIVGQSLFFHFFQIQNKYALIFLSLLARYAVGILFFWTYRVLPSRKKVPWPHNEPFPTPRRKRTMFQNIVNATEPMTDEKESASFVSNNPTRKEIVM